MNDKKYSLTVKPDAHADEVMTLEEWIQQKRLTELSTTPNDLSCETGVSGGLLKNSVMCKKCNND